MSSAVKPDSHAPVRQTAIPSRLQLRGPKVRRRLIAGILVALGALASWFGVRAFPVLTATQETKIPTAGVKRGDLTLSVTAKGELRGGNSDVMTAPMTGGSDMHITLLRRSGEPVKSGEIVVQFDTTEQEYKLKEAQADLAEAEQHVLQAKAQRDADQEEDRYALRKAEADVKLAELDARKNPLLASITAKQNDLALSAARDHLAQLEQNLANRRATGEAAIAMQEAGRGKADAQAATARQNIDAMTLRAHRDGYFSVHQNSSGDFFFFGMTLPLYQVGDLVRGGMAVGEIPDFKSWEIGAKIGELDRGHLTPGEKVSINVIAVPGRLYRGHVKELGSTMGPPWDRRFECKIALDDPSAELRPGMSATIVVTTDDLHQVLWLPAQALFESDGRTFVYAQSGKAFEPKDVKLVRRNETRVVITGLREGEIVALASPVEAQKKKASSGAMQSLPK